MRVLLVAATEPEIAPFRSALDAQSETGSYQTDILVTGAGMVATSFALGCELTRRSYGLAINAGIAGAFDFGLSLGEVCRVTEDTFADLGAEDGDEFIPMDLMGLGRNQFSAHPPENFQYDELRAVRGITVNKVHGHELSIAKAISRFNPEIESMEGAAFFYACEQTKTPCVQIRSISNYVERRDREKWDIPLAISNLNEILIKLLI